MDVLVKDFFKSNKIVIFDEFQINCIKDLIQHYRNTAAVTDAADMNLQDIEKKLDTGLSMNDYKLEKINQ